MTRLVWPWRLARVTGDLLEAVRAHWLTVLARLVCGLTATSLVLLAALDLRPPWLWRRYTLPGLALAGGVLVAFAAIPFMLVSAGDARHDADAATGGGTATWMRARRWWSGRATAVQAAGAAGTAGGALCFAWLGLTGALGAVLDAVYRVRALADFGLAAIWLLLACLPGLLAPLATLTDRGTMRVLVLAMRVRSRHGRTVVATSLAAGVVGSALSGLATLGLNGRTPPWFAYGCLGSALGCAVLLCCWL